MRRSMKKIVCLSLGVCLSVLAFTGCSNTPKTEGTVAEEGNTAGKTNTAKTKITLWTGQRADYVIREEKLAAYNEASEDTEVEMQIYTEDYATTLELSFTSNQAPDIFQVVNNAKYYVDREMLLPLDEFLTESEIARYGDLFGIDQVNMVDGKTYTLAERGITYRLIYNKDILAAAGISEPPKTMEQVYEYAKQITEWGKDQGIYGFAIHLKTPASVGERVIDQVGFRNGISAYNYNEGKYDYSVMKEVLEPFKKMYEEGIMFPGVEGLEIDPLRTQFAAGKIGMYIYGSWEPAIYAEDGQFPAENSWGVSTIPGIGTETPMGKTDIKNAGKSWGISSTSKNPEKSWEYIKYMLSDEYMTEYHEEGYGIVVIPSVAEKAKAPDMAGMDGFAMSTDLDKIWPVRPDTAGLSVEGKNAYDTYASIILGAIDMEQGLSELTERYNAALDKAERDGVTERVIITDFDASK